MKYSNFRFDNKIRIDKIYNCNYHYHILSNLRYNTFSLWIYWYIKNDMEEA